MDKDLTQRLAALETPGVSDAMDRLGIAGQCLGIMPLDRGFRLAGEAFTVRYVPAYEEGATVGDFVDDLGPGQVAVIDNSGRMDATVWGDLMTIVAKRRGLAGTVIDGVCRDLDRALELDYPLFTRGHWMRTGKDRVQLEAIQVPVVVGGVVVRPGDLLLGDANGVVAVPRDRAAEVIGVAEKIQATEDGIRAEVLAGADLRTARAGAGYHRLQTPVS
jgi:4-hydroxy-4-methyl-2-oxoglutarate aldolase